MQVDIDAEQHTRRRLVPAAAVVREGEDAAVFVVETTTRRSGARCRSASTDGEHVEIVSGVKAGEMVIVDGQAGLPDGAAAITMPAEARPPTQ